jgi:hypothetical protein
MCRTHSLMASMFVVARICGGVRVQAERTAGCGAFERRTLQKAYPMSVGHLQYQ